MRDHNQKERSEMAVKKLKKSKMSFAKDDLSKGGGLWPGADVKDGECIIRKARAIMWDDKTSGDRPAGELTIEPIDPPLKSGDKTFSQYYSAGKATLLRPDPDSDDGDGCRMFEPLKPGVGINDQSNLGLLFASGQNAGMPAEELAFGDLAVFDGLHCKMRRVEVKREFANQPEGRKPSEVLVIYKVIGYVKPGEYPKGKKPVAKDDDAPVSKKSKKTEVADDDDADETPAPKTKPGKKPKVSAAATKLSAAIGKILAKAGEAVDIKKLTREVYSKFAQKDEEDGEEMMELMDDAEFLASGGVEGEFEYDKKKKVFAAPADAEEEDADEEESEDEEEEESDDEDEDEEDED